ncbi:MAG: hypothetical protein HYW62_00165 [Candidatus Levybacteria bacterium]|nr:hypothetical protein [Candidatus Levybacteria bacterium]
MEENSTIPKKNRLHALAFLEIGLFEIGFVAVVLFLLFGVLNYFNILPVSDAFPKYLGWLPRQQTKLASQGETLQTKNNPLDYSPVSKPTPQDTFQYDVKKADTLLTQYLKDNIKPEFLPSKIEIKQGLSIDGRTENIKYEFGSQFSSNTDSFSANFHYRENTNDPNDFTIFIQLGNTQEGTLTPSIANSIASSYFNNPYAITSCSTKGTSSSCEEFISENDEKKGYGLIFASDKGKFIPILFTCLVPKTSKDYATQKSCIAL